MTDRVIPTLNLNGTSGKDLLEQVRTAYHAVKAAYGALAAAAPHGRDYQTMPGGAYYRAREQHDERLRSLAGIEADLEAIGLGIQRQMD